MLRQKRFLTRKEKELLNRIRVQNQKLKQFREEVDEWCRQDNPFNANDAKSEADYAQEQLIALLEEADILGMKTDLCPLIQDLTRVYIDEPYRRLQMAGGSGCH